MTEILLLRELLMLLPKVLQTNLPFFRGCTDDGQPFEEGVNEIEAIGNYVSNEEFFRITLGETEQAEIHSVTILLSGNGQITLTDYGFLNIPLSGGVRIAKADAAGNRTFLGISAGAAIKSNLDWHRVGSRVVPTDYVSAANLLQVTLPVKELTGVALQLNPKESVGFVLEDDFTGMLGHSFSLQGTIVRRNLT